MEKKQISENTIPMYGGKTGGTDRPASGAGMDRRIEKKKTPWKPIGIGAGVLAAAAVIWMFVQDAAAGRTFRVNESRIVISTVSEGTFEDFIPIRGRVTPLTTVFLDAIEGGRVERVLVEDGATLKQGDLIVELSNTTLQLDVTRNEALVTEQLNNMRTIELQLEQNRLSHKRNLVDFNYQIKRLTRQVERERELIKTNAVSQAQLDQSQDELEYNINRREGNA